MKKVLITGISGFIGNYLFKYKPEKIILSGTYFDNKPDLIETELIKLDLNEVDTFISNTTFRYDVIIHCAAEASLANCEKNPEKAFAVNTYASEKLARWSTEQNSKFIFLSTDIVFDGHMGNYIESDFPKPINIYGRSKLEAEQKILKVHDNAVIARLALCLGKGLNNTNSFVDWFLTKLESDEPIPLYYDEFRTPISAKFVAKVIWELVFNEFKGIIHLTGKDKINRYEIGIKMLDYLKSNEYSLLKKESSTKSSYTRPKNVSMRSDIFSKIIQIPQENIDALIENIL